MFLVDNFEQAMQYPLGMQLVLRRAMKKLPHQIYHNAVYVAPKIEWDERIDEAISIE